jgi:creatinine amidohydrolase/Fe(II)-dependent formamide hydrolase-like protein
MDRVPRGTLVYSLSYWLVHNEIGHADANETSLILAIRPDLVNTKNVKGGSVKIGSLKSDEKLILSKITAIPSSFPKLANSGVWGNPRNANSRKGRVMLDQISKRLADVIKDVEKVHRTVFKGKNR